MSVLVIGVMFLEKICKSGHLAELLGVTDRHVRRLAESGHVVRVGRGEYDTAASVKSYIRYLNSQIKNKRNFSHDDEDDEIINDFNTEKTKLYKHKAELAKLEEKEKKGLLINKHDQQRSMFRLGRIIRNSILSIPSRLSQPLAAESDHNNIYRILDDELNSILTGLSELDLDEDYPSVDNDDLG